jgi:hypothetical protein
MRIKLKNAQSPEDVAGLVSACAVTIMAVIIVTALFLAMIANVVLVRGLWSGGEASGRGHLPLRPLRNVQQRGRLQY